MEVTVESLHAQCRDSLDQLMSAADAGLTAAAIVSLIDRSEGWRAAAGEAWRELVDEVLSPHPMTELAARCPLTGRARLKPRGYAGDAVMLDMIYDRGSVPLDDVDPQAQEVFRVIAAAPTSASVDLRRRLIASRILRLALARAETGRPPMAALSLACGHARELDFVDDPARRIARIVLCDQDPASLDETRRRYGRLPIATHALTVRSFLTGALEPIGSEHFDFVYTAGLYDYLEHRTAVRLTRALFDRVAPGGQLLVANFHPASRGTGYMEAFMDWWLIYRTDDDMRRLVAEIDPREIAAVEVERDAFDNVVYLTVTRT